MGLSAADYPELPDVEDEYSVFIQQKTLRSMDPEKRTLRRITLDDAVAADETFSILMGEKVEPRKEFIEKNAKYAVNLDY